jgi:hypothetical protein
MKEKVEDRIKTLTEKAHGQGKSQNTNLTRNRSSLHKIIKTKEQASVFMKLLQSS